MASGEKRDISCVSRDERVRVGRGRGRSPRLYIPGINIPRPSRPDHPYPASVPRLDFVNGADSSRRIAFPVVNTEDRAAALALRARGERDPDLEWLFALEDIRGRPPPRHRFSRLSGLFLGPILQAP